MKNAVMTTQQESALVCLLGLLDQSDIRYQVTGGLAGNFHGSGWPLRDIDLDVAEADLPFLAMVLGSTVLEPPRRVVGTEFDLVQFRASILGVVIDVSQAEAARIRTGGFWEPLGTNLLRREKHHWRGRPVWVQPLADLILYKRRLGRAADVMDLESCWLQRTDSEHKEC